MQHPSEVSHLSAEVEVAEVAVAHIHQSLGHPTACSLLGEVLACVGKPGAHNGNGRDTGSNQTNNRLA